MHDPLLFERNMLAIASHHPVTSADRLRNASSDMRVGMDEARDGSPLAYLDYAGRRAYMSSRMHPLREAERLAAEYTQSGFFVFLGLGPGFLAKALLESGRLSSGIIIEYRAGTLRAILERIDLTKVLADKRLLLLVDPSDEELEQAMVERYMPAVSGDIVTVPLASRVDAEPERFQGANRALRAILDKVSDDYSVQAFFGKRWFANIVRNLRYAAGNTPPVGPVREAIITAAGPSLEDAIAALSGRPKQRFLIATDTSLHALLKRGIMPDAVLSIDCQHISYYHFMDGIPKGLPLFLDLASPTTLAKLSERPYFFSSGHPLARYVASRMRAYPQLDTSGGNVTHAAVSLAEYLGASVIDVYGADFSYPLGKSYARGTYIYPYFDLRQSRLRPLEGLFQDFLYRNQSLERQCDADGEYRYLTKPLGAYLRRMEGLAAGSEALLRRHRGRGVASLADYDESKPVPRRGFGRVFAAGKLFMTPKDFLRSYRAQLLALPKPPADPSPAQAAQYIQALQGRDRDIWTTLLPSVAAFRREAGSDMQRMRGVLAEVLAWSVALIDEELKETS